jgi:three-Cys-motif partner protein
VVKVANNDYLSIKPHTLHKYSILKKYLDVCKIFDRHYSNFVYVDTHGGSGRVQLEGNRPSWVDGSPLIAANWTPQFPCHVVEIDPKRYGCLCSSIGNCQNVTAYNDDCNKLIGTILSKIPKGKKFVFCFIDPESLVYRGNDGTLYDQLRADTIRAIADFPRTELLLNFPLESILRCAGDFYEHPSVPRAISNGSRISTFMGSTNWQKLTEKDRSRKGFLEMYMDEMLFPYQHKGAMLVRSEQNNLPLYYLVYATHNYTAAKIMRDIMKKEGNYPIYYDIAKGKYPTLDEAYPLTRFIFEKD